MTKDWLIRTKNNHILGPVTKEKIKQLISNGSIKGDDEICSGNGYWIFIREQDLVARFIFGDEKQTFNPVQEIDPVLSLESATPSSDDLAYPGQVDTNELGQKLDEFGNIMPDQEDLEYPDMEMSDDEDSGESQIEATLVDMNLADLQVAMDPSDALENDHSVDLLPEQGDLEYPDMGDVPPAIPVEGKHDAAEDFEDDSREVEQVKKKLRTPKKRVKSAPVGINRRQTIPKKRETQAGPRTAPEYKKSNITKIGLYTFFILLFILVTLAMFFRKTLVKEIIEMGSLELIPSAHAQSTDASKKKNGF